MYRCPDCGCIFETPDYEQICMEEYCGVSDLFGNRHYRTIAYCPDCGEPLDTEYDRYYEEEEDDE